MKRAKPMKNAHRTQGGNTVAFSAPLTPDIRSGNRTLSHEGRCRREGT